MASFTELIQKAVYLGVGLASYAGEKAVGTLEELRVQAQKLADELVRRGEITTEEARQMVEDILNQATQASPPTSSTSSTKTSPTEIEIEFETVSEESQGDRPPAKEAELQKLRDQIANLQAELQNLQD